MSLDPETPPAYEFDHGYGYPLEGNVVVHAPEEDFEVSVMDNDHLSLSVWADLDSMDEAVATAVEWADEYALPDETRVEVTLDHEGHRRDELGDLRGAGFGRG